jgi:hypothetical protein
MELASGIAGYWLRNDLLRAALKANRERFTNPRVIDVLRMSERVSEVEQELAERFAASSA